MLLETGPRRISLGRTRKSRARRHAARVRGLSLRIRQLRALRARQAAGTARSAVPLNWIAPRAVRPPRRQRRARDRSDWRCGYGHGNARDGTHKVERQKKDRLDLPALRRSRSPLTSPPSVTNAYFASKRVKARPLRHMDFRGAASQTGGGCTRSISRAQRARGSTLQNLHRSHCHGRQDGSAGPSSAAADAATRASAAVRSTPRDDAGVGSPAATLSGVAGKMLSKPKKSISS